MSNTKIQVLMLTNGTEKPTWKTVQTGALSANDWNIASALSSFGGYHVKAWRWICPIRGVLRETGT